MTRKATSSTPVQDAGPTAHPAGRDAGAGGRIVAGLAIATVLAVVLIVARPGVPPTVATTAPAPAAAAPEPATPAAPPLPPDVWHDAFPLVPAEIHLTPEELKATPSTPGMAAAAALARALEPYRAGDHQQAAVELEGVLLDHPDEYRAALYLGVSRLFIDEPQAAIEALRQAQQSTAADVLADAEWYILVGIARLREPDQAEGDARALCDRDGPPAGRACQAVEVLARARAASRP